MGAGGFKQNLGIDLGLDGGTECSFLNVENSGEINNQLHKSSEIVLSILQGKDNVNKVFEAIVEKIIKKLNFSHNKTLFPELIERGEIQGKTDEKGRRSLQGKILGYCYRYQEVFKKRIQQKILAEEGLYSSQVLVEVDGLDQTKNVIVSNRSSNINNIIQAVEEELLDMFYVFGDNLNPVEFEKILMNDANDIGKIKDKVKTDYEKLQGVEYGEKYHGQVENQPQVLKMYKHIVADGIDENGVFSEELVAKKLEAHFERSFVDMITLFSHCYFSSDTNTGIFDDFLILINNFYADIDTLKANNLGFNNESNHFFQSDRGSHIQNIIDGVKKSNKKLYDYKLKEFDKGVNRKKMFSGLLNMGNLSREYLSKVNEQESIPSTKEEFLAKLEELRSDDIKKYSNINYVNQDELGKLELDSVDFETWYRVRPSDRREKFFKNFLVELSNGKGKDFFGKYKKYTQGIESESSDVGRRFRDFLEPHFENKNLGLEGDELITAKEDYINKTIAQFHSIEKELKSFTGDGGSEELYPSIKSFIRNNKNSVDLLVGFFWYNLSQDYIDSNPNDYPLGKNRREILSQNFPPHGMMQSIFSDLKDSGLLDNDGSMEKITIFPDRGLANAASWNKKRMFEYWGHKYSNKPLKLESMYYPKKQSNEESEENLDTRHKHILLINETDLYTPSLDCDNHEEIIKLVDSGLDTCSALLEKRPEDCNNNYLSILQKIGFDKTDLVAVNVLRIFLKYIKSCHEDIGKMIKTASDDKDLLDNWSKKLGPNNFTLQVGPEKKVGRIYQKILSKYSGDLRLISDMTRGMVICQTPKDASKTVSEAIKFFNNANDVAQISLSEYTGNFTEKSPKPSGYRDVNLLIKMKSGNTVEIQFHYKEYYEFKSKGYILGEDFMTQQYIDSEGIEKFTDSEIEKIKSIAEKDSKITLPENFGILCEEGAFKFSGRMNKTNNNLLSSDVLYSLARSCGDDETLLVKKIQKIESAGYDIAGGRTLSEEIFG